MPTTRVRPRRLLIALGLMALVAASAAVTWIAAGRFRSPAEVAARTLAPEPSPILVPVESRVISTDVVTRGTGRFGSPQTLSAVPTALKAGAGYVDSAAPIGTELAEGDVALVISGRPVIILEGAQPGFRDLGPGLSGSDVLQLEEALDRLGFSPGAIDGTYNEDTETAVASWYRSLGYQAMTETAEQRAAIRALQTDLTAIERDALGATEAVARADADVLAARETLRVATLAAATVEDDLATARAETEAANTAAEVEVRSAEGDVALAWRSLPPLSAPAEEIDLAYAQWENLRVIAGTARANADRVRASGEAAVRAAERAAAAAPGDIEAADRALAASESRAALARQAIELATSPSALVEQDLSSAELRAGVQVPADEIIFVSDTPVRVAEPLVARGQQAVGPLLSVTDTVVAIDGTLALDQVALVTEGMEVRISEPDLGIDATGVVGFVAAGPGTRGADGFHVYFETLLTDSAPTSASVVGASVRLSVSVESTGGPVLAVPASALTLAVDGSTHVQVDRDGTIRTVTVEPGLSAAGYVGIAPVDGELAIGDLVVIGFEQQAIAGG